MAPGGRWLLVVALGPHYVNSQSQGALPDSPFPSLLLTLSTQGPWFLSSQMRVTFCEEATPPNARGDTDVLSLNWGATGIRPSLFSDTTWPQRGPRASPVF